MPAQSHDRRQAERLARGFDGEPDGHLGDFGKARQTARHPFGVGTALLDPQQIVFAQAVCAETRNGIMLLPQGRNGAARGQNRP